METTGAHLGMIIMHSGVMDTVFHSYTMGCPPVRGDNPRALAASR